MSDTNKEQKGLTSQRPPCGYKGHTFLATETGILYTDTGSDWVASKPEVREKTEKETAVTPHVEHATKG